MHFRVTLGKLCPALSAKLIMFLMALRTLAHWRAFIQHLLAPGTENSEQDRGGLCPHGAYTSRQVSRRDKPGMGQTVARDVQRTNMIATGWLLETGWPDEGNSLQGHLNDKTGSARPMAGGGAFSQLVEALGGNTAGVAGAAGAEGADRGGAGWGGRGANVLMGCGQAWHSFSGRVEVFVGSR